MRNFQIISELCRFNILSKRGSNEVLYLKMNEHHLSAYFGTLMNQIGKLMVSNISGVKL